MPIVNGEFKKLTEEQIRNRLEQNLKDNLGKTAQPGDLVTKQLKAEAETLAQNQEESLKRVYNAAYLADAEGEDLDKVTDVIGLSRKLDSPATGVVRISRSSYPTSDFTIPNGSTVQTGGSSPIQFNLTEGSVLQYIDGFETDNLTNWTGDTADFSVVNTQEIEGDYALQTPSGSDFTIESDKTDFGVGTVFTSRIKPESGDSTGFRFGVQDDSNYFECVVREDSQDLILRLIEDGSVVSSSSNNSPNISTTTDSYLEIQWSLYGDHTATLYETKNKTSELGSVSLSATRKWGEGPLQITTLNSSASALIDEISTISVLCNVEAENGGVKTNVGPQTITKFSDSIAGAESVTNPVATGNPSIDDTDFAGLVPGKDRETDEEFRERAFETTAIGGSATVNALNTALQQVEEVKAVTINRNRTESTKNNLPPHSFEVVVYGGSPEEIAKAIFNTSSIDSHDVGGKNGEKETYSITSDVTKQKEEISWSRPTKLDLNITLDLIVDDTFVGETQIKSIVANYVGGTDIDGSFVNGIDVGESVYEAVLKREIVSPEQTGVWEVNSITIDSTGDGTDDTTTLSENGADVLEISNSEVAITNARDGSISITTSQK